MAVRAKKKVVLPRRPKTGLAAAPVTSFDEMKYYIHYEVDKKECADTVKAWIKQNFTKLQAKHILANPEYEFQMFSHYVSAIYWNKMNLGEFPDKWKGILERTKDYYKGLIDSGKRILKEKESQKDDKKDVPVITPKQRIIMKANDTIMADLDEVEDQWIAGGQPEFNMYDQMRIHDIKGYGIDYVRNRVEAWLYDYEDAYHKRCEQAVEGYAHLKRPELKRRIKLCESWLLDLDRIKDSVKAQRKPRVKKPRTADKQVTGLKYEKENTEYKLTSIPPVSIVGAMRFFAFNTKTREITEYVSSSAKGFEIKGTTLQHIDEASRKVRLRKPEEFLTIALKKTPKQIDNEWKKLTTKTSSPNGRINGDTILLRVLDR